MAGTVGRVAVVLKVNAGQKTAALCTPPEGASSLWMQKFHSRLQPLEENSFGCCLLGSLEEVSSHLWHHQALWVRLQTPHASEFEQISVHLSELVDPLADLSSWSYVKEVSLEDEGMLLHTEASKGSQVIASIELTALHLAPEEVLARPGVRTLLSKQPQELNAFRLTLSLAEDMAAMEMVAESGTPFQLRLDAVEKHLFVDRSSSHAPQVSHTLVLVEDASELSRALSDLHVCVQVPGAGSSDLLELPVDLSPLAACCARGGGSDEVTAEVTSTPAPVLGRGLPMVATLTAFSWSSCYGEDILPGRPRDADVWALGAQLLAVGLRLWRLSIEIRSIRLTAKDANVYVTYSYPPLRQPRAFRTNPPTPARKKVTVNLPHSFAAHTMTVSFEELEVLLQEPLIAEVWHRDLYRKDSALGIAEASLGQVLGQPLQYSANLPSMVEGFRVVDQVCPILCEDGSQVGALRLLVFLEDLGAAQHVDREEDVQRLFSAAPISKAESAAASVEKVQAGSTTPAASILEGAYDLELWRQTEEDKFRAYLAEQEAGLKARLEEEYRQREEARAADFAQQQAKMQQVETVVRRKLQELQQKELSLTSEEARVSNLQLQAKREAETALAQREGLAKQDMAELAHSLELSRARSQFLQEQLSSTEAQLTAASEKLQGLEKEKGERDAELRAMLTPSPQLKEELKELRLRLREQEVRGEAIAASRDHFKNKVEELCGRLLGSSAESASQEKALTALGVFGTPQAQDATQSIAEALRKVREELANLASNWDRASRRHDAEPSSQGEPQRPATDPIPAMQDPQQAEQYLAWLRAQRRQLLESGLYGSSDAVVLALDVKIAQAEAQMN